MQRLKRYIPEQAGPNCTDKPLDNSLSTFLRTYHYKEGQFSSPHWDRSFVEHEDHASKGGKIRQYTAYSILIYLDEECEGGHTTFFVDDASIKKTKSGKPCCEGIELKISGKVTPHRGDVLIFPHGRGRKGLYPDPLHEGSVVKKGTKTIIRSDLIYTIK